MKKEIEFINLSREELVINVIGTCASGKSAIIDLINYTLKNNGFKTEVNSIDETNFPIDEEERLRSIITKNKKITINEVQAARNLRKN